MSRLSNSVTVRFTPDESDRLRVVSKTLGLTYSQIVRAAVIAAINQPTVRITNDTAGTMTLTSTQHQPVVWFSQAP